MAFDSNLKLYDGSINRVEGTNVYPDANKNVVSTDGGNSLNIGRRGLPRGRAQFIAGVETVGGKSSATGLILHLQLSLDNETTYRDIAVIDFGDPAEEYDGQIVQDCGIDFASQEYADANIELRLLIEPAGSNASNNITADKLYAYIGYGEATMFGLKTGTNLFQD